MSQVTDNLNATLQNALVLSVADADDLTMSAVTGPIGVVYDSTEHHATFSIPTGPTGPIGPTGPTGSTGATGAKIVSTILKGQDASGGNIYEQTFDNGFKAQFTAPKGPEGEGDMSKSDYDTNQDGVVNNSDKLEGHSASYFQQALVSGTNIKTINNNSILGSGNVEIVSGVWGNITGTLSNQTDLQSALQAKQDVIPRNTYDPYGAASAVQGTTSETVESLDNKITEIKSNGKFLSFWNCATGLPTTNPSTLPYNYASGDYYRIGQVANQNMRYHTIIFVDTSIYMRITLIITCDTTIQFNLSTMCQWLYDNNYTSSNNYIECSNTYLASYNRLWVTANGTGWTIHIGNGTHELTPSVSDITTFIDTVTAVPNYQPSGSSYSGTASTSVYSNPIYVGDIFFYDGQNWSVQSGHIINPVTDVKVDNQSVVMNGVALVTISTKENLSNKRATFQTTPDDTHYPSEKLVKDSLDAKADIIRVGTMNLSSQWSGTASPYTQVVNVTGTDGTITITPNSKVDIQPEADLIITLSQSNCNAMYIANNGGVLTCYAIGGHPTTAVNDIQVTITEVR